MIHRIGALVVLLAAALLPITWFTWIQRPEVQLILATIAVGVIVVFDIYTGLLLCFSLLILYFRYYTQAIGPWVRDDLPNMALRTGGPMQNLVTKYITPEHLHDAQSNDISSNEEDLEIKGIQGVYGEPVYGAQGLDHVMPGLQKIDRLDGMAFTMDD